jgi:hypothetical protein
VTPISMPRAPWLSAAPPPPDDVQNPTLSCPTLTSGEAARAEEMIDCIDGDDFPLQVRDHHAACDELVLLVVGCRLKLYFRDSGGRSLTPPVSLSRLSPWRTTFACEILGDVHPSRAIFLCRPMQPFTVRFATLDAVLPPR